VVGPSVDAALDEALEAVVDAGDDESIGVDAEAVGDVFFGSKVDPFVGTSVDMFVGTSVDLGAGVAVDALD